MDTPFTELPVMINVDPLKYYKTRRDQCYWTNEKYNNEEMVNNFIDRAKIYKLTEDQALAILMYNEFDFNKAKHDMEIFRPIKGLEKLDVKPLVKVISGGIIKTVRSRQHRDFDEILLNFPGYTIGDVLGVYSKHRYFVKKQTYKVKKYIKRSTPKPTLSNEGVLKDIETMSWNDCYMDTQFQLLYQKHYAIIKDSHVLEDFMCRDLLDLKPFNYINNKLSDIHNEADTILSLLKKMNRKRNQFGYMFEETKLLRILSSAELERQNRSVNTTPNKCNESNEQKLLGISVTSDIINIDSEVFSDMSIEDQLYHYIKHDNSFLITEEDPNFGRDKEILRTLEVLSEKHEALLDGFKNLIPNPDVFQQLCHSWSNMDFAILLLGLSEFGKNFDKISDSIFTKSEAMVTSFYLNYGAELSLDDVVLQSLRNTEFHQNSKSNGSNEMITTTHIKAEEDVESHTSSTVTRKKRIFKTPVIKKEPMLNEEMTLKDGQENNGEERTLSTYMSLRSHIGSKNKMKELIDEEMKAKNLKYNSKRVLKRKAQVVNSVEGGKPYKSKRINIGKDVSA